MYEGWLTKKKQNHILVQTYFLVKVPPFRSFLYLGILSLDIIDSVDFDFFSEDLFFVNSQTSCLLVVACLSELTFISLYHFPLTRKYIRVLCNVPVD